MSQTLLDIAKELIKLNPKICISGSLALNMQGVRTRREPKDLDMYLPFGVEFKTPEGMELWDQEEDYGDGSRTPYMYKDVKVDIFQPLSKFESDPAWTNCSGNKVILKNDIVSFKVLYCFENSETSKKHREDLIFIMTNLEPMFGLPLDLIPLTT